MFSSHMREPITMRADVTSRTLPSSRAAQTCLSISQPISHLLHVSYILHCCLHTSLADLTSVESRCKIMQTSFLQKVCKLAPTSKLNFFTARSFLGCEYDPQSTLTSSLLLHPSFFYTCIITPHLKKHFYSVAKNLSRLFLGSLSLFLITFTCVLRCQQTPVFLLRLFLGSQAKPISLSLQLERQMGDGG